MDLSIPTDKMTLEQLAAAMTGVVDEVNGDTHKTYRAAKPNYELAQKVQDEMRVVVPKVIPGLFSTRTVEHPDWLFRTSAPNQPGAWDSRVAENVSNFPFSTVVYMQLQNGKGQCSGTYVGPHEDTLITAAHCMYVNGGGGWTPVTTFTPAAVGTDGSGTVAYAPFGSFNGCYRRVIPGAWISNNCKITDDFGTCTSLDYAVVDFRGCGNATIAATGSMGIASSQTGLPNIHTDGFPAPYNVVGNPPNTTTPGTTIAGGFGAYPFECGMEGPVKNNSFTVESETLNLSQGDSGGPWWEVIGGNTVVIAITTGYRQYGDISCPVAQSFQCYVNFGRWIDGTVMNFLNAYSLL